MNFKVHSYKTTVLATSAYGIELWHLRRRECEAVRTVWKSTPHKHSRCCVCVSKCATWLLDNECFFEWNERPANKATLDVSCIPDNRLPNKASIFSQHLSRSGRYISVYDKKCSLGTFLSYHFSSFSQVSILLLRLNNICRILHTQQLTDNVTILAAKESQKMCLYAVWC